MKSKVTRSISNRRKFIERALVGFAGGSLAGMPLAAATDTSPAPSAWKKKKLTALSPSDVPTADVGYTQGIVADCGRIIAVSGKGPDDLKADMETQMHQTFKRIERILKLAGASFDNVIFCRSYFVNIPRDLPVFRKVRKLYFSKPYPASTVVGVTGLAVEGLDIEIEVLAVL